MKLAVAESNRLVENRCESISIIELVQVREAGKGLLTMDMGDEAEPLSNRRRLSAELRRLRDQAGISGRELAGQIGTSQSKVSRIEAGTAIPSSQVVAAWAEAVGASAENAQLLAALTESAFTEVHAWRTAMHGRQHLQGRIQDLEHRSRTILTFQHSVIPGLLQTAEYARKVFALFEPPYPDCDIAAALAARLDRQMALFDEGRKFKFLITEAALRWRPGPAHLLITQYDRVASLSTLSNVSIGLIPYTVQALATTSHSFVLLEDHDAGNGGDEDDDAIVMVETVHAHLTVSDPESVALYRKRWSLLERMAIFDNEARAFLDHVGAELRAEET